MAAPTTKTPVRTVEQRLANLETGQLTIQKDLTTIRENLTTMQKTNPMFRPRIEKPTRVITDGEKLVSRQEAFQSPGEWEVRGGEWVKVAKKPAKTVKTKKR
jgi:hypothetical protein